MEIPHKATLFPAPDLKPPEQLLRKVGNFHFTHYESASSRVFSVSAKMPSVATSNPKAEELISAVDGLDGPPATRPENITTLIESVDRYNPESLEVLEAYLEQQCSEGTFDCLADLAILKL
jgi:hypothetical protein